jgi:hypothetical protein
VEEEAALWRAKEFYISGTREKSQSGVYTALTSNGYISLFRMLLNGSVILSTVDAVQQSRQSWIYISEIGNSVKRRAGKPEFDSRPGQKMLIYSTDSRPALVPIQPPSQWVPRHLSQCVMRLWRAADHLYPVPRLRMVGLHLHSPIRLHGVVLNWLINCTGPQIGLEFDFLPNNI